MKSIYLLTLVFTLTLFCCVNGQDDQGIYKIGTGIADITGPAAGVVLNGYVNPLTLGAGIHTRLHARSFVVESLTTGSRVAFVSCDLAMLDHAIKLEVVKKLKAKFGDDRYSEKNILISSTHTHSGPSGYMQYYAYLVIESYGFNPLSFWAIVDGIFDSIVQADSKLVRGKVHRGKGELLEYNGNRRDIQYLENPEAERNMYKYNVDKDMVILRFDAVDESGDLTDPLGVFAWWPLHPISFNGGLNPLVSSDNRGYASVMFDYAMNEGVSARPGHGKFVAAFAATNLGDVSPRYGGQAKSEDDLESVRIVGTAQFEFAFELYSNLSLLTEVKGPIQFVQQYVDMTNVQVTINNDDGQPEVKTTCKAALGYAFVGLTPETKPLWDLLLSAFNATPSVELEECQKPKQVALPAGEMKIPWEWAPSIADLQILRVGTTDIVGTPGELTTMAGRRLRRAIEVLVPSDHEVIVSGLANNYINYVATPEEYGLQPVQEYEAGATIFGPYTLNAIIQSQEALVTAMNEGNAVDQGPPPPNFIDQVRDEIPDRVDRLPAKRTWGEVFTQPPPTVAIGTTLRVVFITPSLRHNPLRGRSHFLVEKQLPNGEWEVARTDADLDTTFEWNALLNRGIVKWRIPNSPSLVGTYRVTQTGYYLEAKGESPKPYSGASELFQVFDANAASSTENYETTPTESTTPNSAQIPLFSAISLLFALSFVKMM